MTSDLSHHRRTARNIAVLFVGVIIGLLLTIGLGGRSASAQSGPPGDPAQTVVNAKVIMHHCLISGGGQFCDPNEEDLSPHWKANDRVGGADRYETSALIAQYQQDPELTYLLVASGNGVDAIAAGTHLTGPLVLVPHGGDTVPDLVLGTAAGINPDVVVFLGGTGAVTEAQAEAILDQIAIFHP